MWLWTLQAGAADDGTAGSPEGDEGNDDPEGAAKKSKVGFMLEYDAARKIAQGLGARFEDLGSLVEVSGETARLLPVGERARYLFGKDEGRVTSQRKKREPQMDLFKVLEKTDGEEAPFGETKVEHQGLLSFSALCAEANGYDRLFRSNGELQLSVYESRECNTWGNLQIPGEPITISEIKSEDLADAISKRSGHLVLVFSLNPSLGEQRICLRRP